MQTTNPFELILSRLDELQFSVNNLATKAQKDNAKSAEDSGRLLDLTEAAQIVRKPIGTVRHYIHHRSLPATKIAKSYLIKFGELIRWVDEFKKVDVKEDVTSKILENRKRYRKP